MSDFVFNIAKGRVAELYNRVKTNDPANSAIVVVAVNRGADTDATMKDRADLAALLGGTTDEVTNTGYARLVLDDSALAALAVDNANDRMPVDLPDLNFGAISAGTAWTDLVFCYDGDTTGGTDANIIPLVCSAFAITPDGSTVVATIADLYRAT